MQRLGAAEDAAPSASMAVRARLRSGCWAVSDTPEVWVCVRSCHELRVLGAEPVAHQARPQPAGGADLRDLLEEVEWKLKKNEKRGRKASGSRPRRDQVLHVGEAVGDREGELLGGRRPGLADVVAGDRDRVPERHLGRAELDQVADQAHAGPLGDDPLLLGDELLEDVRLERAATGSRAVEAALLGGRHEQRQRHGRRAGDGHRDGDRVEVDPVVKPPRSRRRDAAETPSRPTSPADSGWSGS